jgi:hypothetical protein
MATNIWEHPEVIAMEALTHLEDALVIGPLCAKDLTSDFTTRSNGWKVGESVSFRTHGEYEVEDFAVDGTVTAQPISSSTRSLSIEKHYDISIEVGAREATMELDSFSDQVIRPATYKLAEQVDTYLGTKILEAAGLYVSSGLYETAADIALARKAAILQQLSLNRYSLVDIDLEAILLGQTWFNQSQTRGGDGEMTLRNATMGRIMGMDWFSSIAFPTNSTAHTCGTLVAETNNTGGTKNLIGDEKLIVDAMISGRNAAVGDRLRIAGVRRPLRVKTAIAETDGITEIALVDPITEIIPDDAAVTVIGHGEDITYHGAIMDDRSIGVAFPMLDIPEDRVAATASNNGVSIRIVKGYDLSTKKTTMSLDLLVGAFAIDPRRITLVAESAASGS